MKSNYLKLASLAVFGTIGLSTLVMSPVFAAGTTTICDQCGQLNGPPAEVCAANGCNGYSNSNDLQGTITGILNGIIGALGIVAVIFIIIGGINYMTSAGDTSKLEKGKKTILYACIGLVICVLAFAIVNWVIGTALKDI